MITLGILHFMLCLFFGKLCLYGMRLWLSFITDMPPLVWPFAGERVIIHPNRWVLHAIFAVFFLLCIGLIILFANLSGGEFVKALKSV